jgi:hypothetical protein
MKLVRESAEPRKKISCPSAMLRLTSVKCSPVISAE